MVDNILGNGTYDVKESSAQIKSGLEYLYHQITLIQIETAGKAKNEVLVARRLEKLVDFDKLRKTIQQGMAITSNIHTLLGDDKNKSYLTLFQNNMELRPTGGFIGSYGIAEFGGGKLNGLTINDIYSADGQLKGHIEPPAPIKDYLGEANWFFRDSNWNPDFATSALRAEWFLNKEMEQQVDGTIAIDLTPIKKILVYTGPIFLPDYNLTISSENLYEKTQAEAQANFFPGSRKKASFLTALSRVLIREIPNINSKQKLGILKSIYEGLEERSIQIHLNNNDLQRPVDDMGWSGNISTYTCGESCYSDFFGDVESNVGVNKSNYFISRKIDFDVSINKDKIVRNLDVNLTNSANPSLGPSGQYKTYLRILIPTDSQMIGVKVANGQSENNLSFDTVQTGNRYEIGVYVEILPSESKTINFNWASDIDPKTNIDSYGLVVRKQAGTGSDPLSVQINSIKPVNSSRPDFSLTKQGVYKYNTNLGKDFFARLSFTH
jgi:hypothetical protein